MAITVRDGEKVNATVNFHWIGYFWHAVWALICISPPVVGLFRTSLKEMPLGLAFVLGAMIIGLLPLAYRWYQNRCKVYAVTNQRLYVEEGIISKTKIDIPLGKVNDVAVRQGILDRIVGAGTITILTGNDTPLTLRGIDDPNKFREAVSALVGKHVT